MLRLIKTWPNTTTATICAVVMAIVFLLSFATSPASHGPGSAVAAMPDDPVYNQPVRPAPALPQGEQ